MAQKEVSVIETALGGLAVFLIAFMVGAWIRSWMDLREARDFWEKHGDDR
jgi:hypothetical protein